MRFKPLIFLFILLILLTGCVKDDAVKLIETSNTTGNLLIDYYDQLIKYTIETWELEAFNSSLRKIDFSIEEQEEYQTTIKHLQDRKKVIKNFVKLLPQLETLLNNKSNENIKETVTELGYNINNIKPMTDNEIVIPSKIMGSLSGDILEMVQFFEIKYFAKTLKETLEKFNELFEKKSEYYLAIIEERNNKSLTIVRYMIDNELVYPWALIESAPGTVNLEMAVSKKPAKEEQDKEALKKVLEVKYFRMAYVIKSAQEELTTLMSDLIKLYDDFVTGKKMVFENIVYVTQKVNGYLTDIDSYHKSLRREQESSSVQKIVYRGNSESKVFHIPDCRYYDSPNCTVTFTTRSEAVEEGYAPCEVCKP